MSSERPTRIDTAALKVTVDLVAFAQRFTTLRQVSHSGEFAGPCPRCGGEDRFHVKPGAQGARFYCRQCYPRGGDVIDLAQLVYEADFLQACRLLADEFTLSSESSERPMSVPPPILARSAVIEPDRRQPDPETLFQRSAARTVAATTHLLQSPDGAAGRTYLRQRGLSETTWRAFGLGYGRTFHRTRGRPEPTIFIPWFAQNGTTVQAVRHRFMDVTLRKGERYAAKPGSKPLLFGLHLLQPAEQVVIVEGEFNCMALHQSSVMALSVGSESAALSPAVQAQLQTVLHRDAQIVLWFDNSQYANQLAARLADVGPFSKDKLRTVTSSQDANDLLVAGKLAAVLVEQGVK